MKRLYTGLVVIALLSACGWNSETYRVKDVAKQETIVLRNGTGRGPVYSLTVKGKGEIRGNATITLILNGKPYKKENISGKVHFKWGGDWYSEEAQIIYQPSSVFAGQLSLEYEFND